MDKGWMARVKCPQVRKLLGLMPQYIHMGHCIVVGVAGGYYLGGGPQGVLSGVATFAFRLGRAAA